MFVVVTQRSRVAANRARSSRLGPYQPSRWSAALPHFCAGRCACWLLPGIRHTTHARTRSRTRLSTYPSCLYQEHSFLGIGGEGRGGGGEGCLVCLWGGVLSSPRPRLFDVETGLGSPDIDRSVFPVLPASVPHMPLKKIGPMCMCHSLLLFSLPLFDTSEHSTTPLHMYALSYCG